MANKPSTDEFSEFRSPDEASFDKFVAALDRAYHKPGVMMWRAFLNGIMNALGNALGWTLIIIASGYIFQALGGIELLKEPLQKFQDSLIQSQTNSLRENLGDSIGTTPTP